MATSSPDLYQQARRAIDERKHGEAICFLAEIVSTSPMDRDARMQLAMSLGDAGNPAGALKIIRTLAERLIHEGFLLPAIAVIQQGLARMNNEKSLFALLERMHVVGAYAKAGTLATPPPLPPKRTASKASSAAELVRLPMEERLPRIAEIGCDWPPAGPPAQTVPLPLFGELDSQSFVSTVQRLKYKRARTGDKVLEEGAPGDSLIVLISGNVDVLKGTTKVGQLGSGAVLGEMALITRAKRSATVMATEVVEFFELGRAEVAQLTQQEPKVMQELAAYCRNRLLMNLLRASPLFSRFDEQTRVSLLGHFKTQTIGSGDACIAAGSPGTGLYVIASGRAQVQARDPDGKSVLLATLGPGDVFGEISLIKQRPATADVIAIETLGVIVLPPADFQGVLAKFPDVHKYLETLSDQRLAATQDAVGMGYVDPDDIIVL